MEDARLREARRLAGLLEDLKNPWVPRWREAARWIAPWRGRFDAGAGFEDPDSRERILDATAGRALRVLASGLHSGLTSPARPWFRLKRGGDADVESGPERRWLDVVEQSLYGVLAGSNFYQAVHSLYTELALFGSACLYMESDPERHVRFACPTCGEFAWSCDAAGRVDTVARRMLMTPRQLESAFGEEVLSRDTKRLLREKPDAPLEIMHLVAPRATRNPAASGRLHMPFASLVWEVKGAERLLHEGGFEEFPFLCARWDVLGADIYGRSPGMEILPDVRMLQEMTRSRLLAVHKMVNPPMRVPAGFKQRLSLIPGAVNYVNPHQPDGIGPLYQISPDLQALARTVEDVRRAVREGFFNDLFMMFTGEGRSNITATEIAERGEEKMLLLGPVIERHQTEILDPLLARAFGLASRAGLLPEAPLSMRGGELKVEYVSSLAQAQRRGGAEAVRRLTAEVSTLAAVAPGVLDKIDFEQAVDELASIAGVPARLVRSDAEVAALREPAPSIPAEPGGPALAAALEGFLRATDPAGGQEPEQGGPA